MHSKIGQRIKQARLLQGMTQQELGIALGFSESGADVRIAQYESGRRTPKEQTLNAIAQALHVSVAFLTSPAPDSDHELIQLILSMDDQSLISLSSITYPNREGQSVYLTPNLHFTSDTVNQFLTKLFQKKQELMKGLITENDYINWKIGEYSDGKT